MKTWNGREHAIESELNPEFLITKELDMPYLTEDWKLEVTILDKSNSLYRDQLIGSTVIDLESRHHSDLRFLCKTAARVEKD